MAEDHEWLWRFYSGEPTGPASQGGYDFLHGQPRKLPRWAETEDDRDAYLAGYDECKRLFPNREYHAPSIGQ